MLFSHTLGNPYLLTSKKCLRALKMQSQTVVPPSSYISHLTVTYLSLAFHFMVALVLPHNERLEFFKRNFKWYQRWILICVSMFHFDSFQD